MNYDSSWFVEKELFIESLREDINSKSCLKIRQVFHSVLDFYQLHIDLIRIYVTTFDKLEKKKLKIKARIAKRNFIEGIDLIENLMSTKSF